jgi:trehalose utilization protein
VGSAAGADKKILLIGYDKDEHPIATHEYLPECELLAKCLKQTPGIEPVVSNRWPKDPQVAEGAAAIVMYVPWGANVLFDGPQRDTALKLLNAGAGLVALHWATGANGEEMGRLWMEQMGAWFHTDFSKLAHIKHLVHQVDPKHPICRGWEEFELFDEYYFDLRFAPEAKPQLTVEHMGQTQTVGWTFERPGGGRSFGFDAGHYHKSFADDSFRRAVVNGILWAAQIEVPENGAPCAVTPEDLKLSVSQAAK